MKYSFTFSELSNAAKLLFLEEAELQIRKKSDKINVSRLSLLTGLDRRDVRKLFREKKIPEISSVTIVEQVVGRWRQDKRFTTRSGEPRVLTYQGEKSEFRRLVYQVNTNFNAGTVLFELERLQMVERTKTGLKLHAQFPGYRLQPEKGFELLSRGLDAFIEGASENLLDQPDHSNLHIHTEYDNIALRHLPDIRRWLIKEGKVFHKKARNFISRFDKDLNSRIAETEPGQGRVVLTSIGLTKSPELAESDLSSNNLKLHKQPPARRK